MLEALAEGYNMAMTADVPKVSRVAGRGIILLARKSGRPIFPFALATSRFKRLDNWDRSSINLPFGRGAMVTAIRSRAGATPTMRPRSCAPARAKPH